jgi:hypothetical protein
MKTIENADGSKTVYMQYGEWMFGGKVYLEKLNEGDLVIFTDNNRTMKVVIRKFLDDV